MNCFDILKKNNIIYKEQGYAFFFYHNGKIIEKVNGKVSDENSAEIDFETNFRLASVSKQFIAYSIVDLIHKSKLSYDTIVKDLYEDLPEYFSKITIKNLLNHTSGIYDYEDMEHKEEDPQVLDREILDFLKTTDKTYFEIGTKYRYSNTAYILLGLIVEEVSNISIVEYINENIFKKAGMKDSYVNIQGKTEINKRAYGHVIENDKFVVKDQYWCSATIGDGGLYSSINDLKKWVKFLAESEYYAEMIQTNYVGEGEYNEYCLGLRNINYNGKEIIYHCGSTIGTSTLLLFSKDLNL
jgi:CubicO group peptidase (beta-lactamase class C family)